MVVARDVQDAVHGQMEDLALQGPPPPRRPAPGVGQRDVDLAQDAVPFGEGAPSQVEGQDVRGGVDPAMGPVQATQVLVAGEHDVERPPAQPVLHGGPPRDAADRPQVETGAGRALDQKDPQGEPLRRGRPLLASDS